MEERNALKFKIAIRF